MERAFFLFYLLAGAACLAYYALCGVRRGFSTDVLWLWAAVGGACLLAALAFLPHGVRRAPAWCRGLLVGATFAALFAFACVEYRIARAMRPPAAPPAAYVLVLGVWFEGEKPGAELSARVEVAARLLRRWPAALAVASGGQGADESLTEAACIRRELMGRGIAPSRIVTEDKSRATVENMRFCRRLIPGRDASVAVVTSGFHLYRALRLARQAGFRHVAGVAAWGDALLLPHFMMREFLTVAVDTLRGNLPRRTARASLPTK